MFKALLKSAIASGYVSNAKFFLTELVAFCAPAGCYITKLKSYNAYISIEFIVKFKQNGGPVGCFSNDTKLFHEQVSVGVGYSPSEI